jgi:hypothetical protein
VWRCLGVPSAAGSPVISSIAHSQAKWRVTQKNSKHRVAVGEDCAKIVRFEGALDG